MRNRWHAANSSGAVLRETGAPQFKDLTPCALHTQCQMVALCNVCAPHYRLCLAFSGVDIDLNCNKIITVPLCDCEIL